jgi:two-component system nitrate/nitrite response regulator NarL
MVRVVVGDDHPLFSDAVVRALASSGAVGVVAEAGDGVTALALINPHRPDVALLDYRMPGLDGAQVAAAVRRDGLPTRVLLLSAHDESVIVYRALQDGAAGFLPKESTRKRGCQRRTELREGSRCVVPARAADPAGEIRRRADRQRHAGIGDRPDLGSARDTVAKSSARHFGLPCRAIW